MNIASPDTNHPSNLSFAGKFYLRKVYVNDLSLETPHSPGIFNEQWEPVTDVNLRTEPRELGDGDFEVMLAITVTVTLGERTALIAEVHQAGIFHITGLTHEELPRMLGVYCPGLLFPYAREAISNLTVRGGFPPIILAPINFDLLFNQQKSQSISTNNATTE